MRIRILLTVVCLLAAIPATAAELTVYPANVALRGKADRQQLQVTTHLVSDPTPIKELFT